MAVSMDRAIGVGSPAARARRRRMSASMERLSPAGEKARANRKIANGACV